MRRAHKTFAGPRVRALREARGWSLGASAQALKVSVSYLSQIEGNQRPLTTRVMLSMAGVFGASAEYFDVDEDQRLAADLRDALRQSEGGGVQVSAGEIQRAAAQTPTLARRYLDLHRANLRLDERLRHTEEAVALDETPSGDSLLPYEEVRDFFHHQDNHIDGLDRAAEAMAAEYGLLAAEPNLPRLARALEARWGVSVVHHQDGGLLRRYDPLRRELSLSLGQPGPTQAFQMAYQLAAFAVGELIEDELDRAGFRTAAARDVCRVGLGNYAASALLMPYGPFAAAARAERHDIERLALLFQCSLEQVAHRLSTLQRPGQRGLPLYFVRLDSAGNITKRHSATRMRFARFGGACPLWNVHDAVTSPGRFLVQLAEMPDGVRYLSVARSVVKPAQRFGSPDRRYVIAFGCEAEHVSEMVYGDGVDLTGPAMPIGVSCRICERDTCPHRAFPPVDRAIGVPAQERRIVPYTIR